MNNGYGEHFRKLKAQKGLSNLMDGEVKTILARPKDTSSLRSKRSDSAQPSAADQIRKRILEKKSRAQKIRAKKKFPVQIFVLCILGAGFAGAGMMYHSEIDQLISKVEISFMGEAQAKEDKPKADKADAKAKSTAEKAAESAKSTEANTEAAANADIKSESKPDQIDHFLKLTERKKSLDLREEELNRLEAELAKQREEIEKKLKTLEETRTGISTVLQERAVKDSEKVDTLVSMYSNMKPSQAAKVLESMDEDLAVEIVGRMKKKNAAEVMNLMKSEKAQVFSEKYAGYRKR